MYKHPNITPEGRADTTVVERRSVKRDYGFAGVEAIIDHPKHGRIFVADGFGGKGSLEGGAVRFRHGMVCKLREDDTFGVLDRAWNDEVNILDAVVNGYDNSRPVLEWGGYAIESLASRCKLDDLPDVGLDQTAVDTVPDEPQTPAP